MFTPYDRSHDRRLSNTRRREASQISQDKRLARHLQAQFDREINVAPGNLFPLPAPRPRRMIPSITEVRGRRRTHADSNLWSSRGPSGAVSALPFLPAPETVSTLTHNPSSNYSSLASHIRHITPNDAHRLLQAASFSGHTPSSSVGGARRQSQFHSNPAHIFNAIMGRHNSYEELLELAERLGPSQTRGLSREEISRLPSRTHRKKDGYDKSCVVCMSEFLVREKIRTLRPCRHDFHQKCIDRWLKDHNTCPICRETVQTVSS